MSLLVSIVARRIAPGQGPDSGGLDRNTVADLYATEAAAYLTGIGYYSWNEMVDVHMVPNEGSTAPPDAHCQVSQEEHDKLYSIVNDINQKYLGIYESQEREVRTLPSGVSDQGLNVLY